MSVFFGPNIKTLELCVSLKSSTRSMGLFCFRKFTFLLPYRFEESTFKILFSPQNSGGLRNFSLYLSLSNFVYFVDVINKT